MEFNDISNADGCTRISFTLKSATPFTIYEAKWHNVDSVMMPNEPFSLIAHNKEISGKSSEWNISIDFPFCTCFDYNDELILSTNKGEVRCRTTVDGELHDTIDSLKEQYTESLIESNTKSRWAWNILYASLAIVFVCGVATFFLIRRRLALKHRKIEELSILISDNVAKNKELQAKVDDLYGKRLDTLNMLCNEYFEKSASEKLKVSLYNDVENHILSLRNKENIRDLTAIVNTYLDNIINKVETQIPELTTKDIVFLTYLYAGFSPRAICIFTDIKIKNFYNRRSRLKERILASNAVDKEFFVSKM